MEIDVPEDENLVATSYRYKRGNMKLKKLLPSARRRKRRFLNKKRLSANSVGLPSSLLVSSPQAVFPQSHDPVSLSPPLSVSPPELLLSFSPSTSSLSSSFDCIFKQITGRRIVDMQFVFQQIWKIDTHSLAFDCRISDLDFVSEICRNLTYEWQFSCRMCKQKFSIYSDKSIDPQFTRETIDHMPVLTAAVGGVISSGNGQVVLDTILSAIEIPSISTSTYTRASHKINMIFEKAAEEEMKKAGKEEADLATFYGDVSSDGIPNIKVVADGCWSRRSFGTNYASLGGVAAIIGARTQKVLYIGIKNKYCYRCSRGERQTNISTEKRTHICFKNYEGNSASMEQAAILDGFRSSMEMHNVRYSHLIADGDSSVYKKILEADPYGEICRVVKVSCKNHILRCFRRNLEKYCNTTSNKFQPLVDAKRLIKARRIRLSNAIDAACKFRASEKNQNAVQLLKNDILNVPSHIFGFHENCADYFCKYKNEKGIPNLIPQLKKTEAFEKMYELIVRVACNSDSLILNETNNIVESFNSIICKSISGKRVNYTGSSGYHGRSYLSVLLFNRQSPMKVLHEEECPNKSPGAISSKKYLGWLERRDSNKLENKKFKRKVFSQPGEDYGLMDKPDMEPDMYEEKAEQFMLELQMTDEERKQLEIETRGQSNSTLWKEERRKRITASHFGVVCKMGSKTSSANTVSSIVATSFHGNKATEYGNAMEERAREELATEIGTEIVQCGLLIHPDYPFLGASPDGLVNTDQVVEIKCPFTLENKTEDEAENLIHNGGIKCLDSNGNLKKNHNYYFQIQGQLEISDRNTALFVIYCPTYLYILEIERDRIFWRTKMLPRLISFFNNCLLPELVDSRLDRQRPLRSISFSGNPVVSKKEKREQTDVEKIY